MKEDPYYTEFKLYINGCSREQAKQILIERLGYDEDLGFDYSLDWELISERSCIANSEPSGQPIKYVYQHVHEHGSDVGIFTSNQGDLSGLYDSSDSKECLEVLSNLDIDFDPDPDAGEALYIQKVSDFEPFVHYEL